jgi:hypothetical protein
MSYRQQPGADDSAAPTFDELDERFGVVHGVEEDASLLKAEIAAVAKIYHKRGAITELARKHNASVKTTSEHANVVIYYQEMSARQNLGEGQSVVRELLDEFPVLTWSHLRIARRYNKQNPQAAMLMIQDAIEHGEKGMTVDQLERHMLEKRKSLERQTIAITRDGPFGRLTINISSPAKEA